MWRTTPAPAAFPMWGYVRQVSYATSSPALSQGGRWRTTPAPHRLRLSPVSIPPRAPRAPRGGCNGRLSLVSTPPRAPRAPREGCNRLSPVSIPPRAPRAPLEIPKMGVDPNLFALFAHLPSNHCVRTKIWLSTLVAWHETRSSNASTRRDAQRSRCQSVKPCRCTDRQETCDSGLRTGRNTRANPPGWRMPHLSALERT